jgi:hypothetical protein
MPDVETTLQSLTHLMDREQVAGTLPGQYVRSLWKSALLILMLTGLFVVYLLIKPGGPRLVNLGDNISQGLLEAVGLLLTLPLFWQGSGRGGRFPAPFTGDVAPARTPQRWVPLLLGLAILSYIVGQALWTYNEDIAHLTVLFPTWADAGFLGSYPFVLFALLLVPTRPLTADTRTRILLDSLMIMVGVTTFSWFFILGPTILQGAGTVLVQVIGTAYPLTTLVLIFCLLLLVIHSHDRAIRPVALILGLAFIIIVVTDSIYDYQVLHNMYATGGLLDVGWPLGYMLVGLGARALRAGMDSGYLSARAPDDSDLFREMAGKSVSSSSLWKPMLPYLFVPVVVLLLAYTVSASSDGILKLGVFLGTALLMGLLILRQFFALRETLGHNQKLWEMRQQVIEVELAREKAERLKVERILALNEALMSNEQVKPHARILALGHYQVRDSQGTYYNVFHREVGDHQTFECECPHYQRQAICQHSLAAAALHTASEAPQC